MGSISKQTQRTPRELLLGRISPTIGDAFLALMAAAAVGGAAPVEAVQFACDGAAALLRARLRTYSDIPNEQPRRKGRSDVDLARS